MPALSTSTNNRPAYEVDGFDASSAIPYGWTAEEALVIVTFLEDLTEQIWSRFGFAIRGCTLRPEPLLTQQLMLPFSPLWDQSIEDDLRIVDGAWLAVTFLVRHKEDERSAGGRLVRQPRLLLQRAERDVDQVLELIKTSARVRLV